MQLGEGVYSLTGPKGISSTCGQPTQSECAHLQSSNIQIC
jgi:hypothetical protein